MTNVLGIIQARLGSTRLPGKVLSDIAGRPMLARILERVAAARTVNEIVVATTDLDEDVGLCQFVLNSTKWPVFRGAALDVLDRFYRCAQLHKGDIIVRITADDPLKDAGIIDHAVNLLLANPELDYCSNTLEPTFPEGLDIEVFRFAALERAHAKATLPSEREHVTPYIYKNPEIFRVMNFTYKENLSSWRWTVDEQVDLDFMNIIFAQYSQQPLVPFESVVRWLEAHPEVREMNSSIVRNAGYIKSLAAEGSNLP